MIKPPKHPDEAKMTPELVAMREVARNTLSDKSMSDADSDAAVAAYNDAADKAGIKAGSLLIAKRGSVWIFPRLGF